MFALVTGTGFYNLDALEGVETVEVLTPYGSVPIARGRWRGGAEVLFLARHGADHSVAPHTINYRANVWALHELGATNVVATAVSGAIGDGLELGDFVLIDDFIDFTTGRPSTFFDEPGKVTHTDMTDPYDSDLRQRLANAAASAQVPMHVGGTYCATNGPRFETKAEIAMMRMVGGTLVGMTGCPEVVLANELGLRYASVGVVSNAAAGLGERDFTVEEIMAVLAGAVAPFERVLDELFQGTDL